MWVLQLPSLIHSHRNRKSVWNCGRGGACGLRSVKCSFRRLAKAFTERVGAWGWRRTLKDGQG